MQGETYLDIADFNYETSLKILREDPLPNGRSANMAYYFSEQAIELLLRHLLEESGAEWGDTQQEWDPAILVSLLPSGLLPQSLTKELQERGTGMLNIAQKSMGCVNFRPARQDVDYSLDLYRRIRQIAVSS